MSENTEKYCYVYLLGDTTRDGVYKIGVTRGTIENRIKRLQTGNSGEIYMVNYFKTKHPFFIERWMHMKYFGKKVLNEWFEMGFEDIIKFKDDCQKFEDLYNVSHGEKINLDNLK